MKVKMYKCSFYDPFKDPDPGSALESGFRSCTLLNDFLIKKKNF